jgi:hypothetical protein
VRSVQPGAFAPRQRSHVVRAEGGYHAFVPPPELSFDHALVGRLSAADHALGQLSGVGRTGPNPYLVSRPTSHHPRSGSESASIRWKSTRQRLFLAAEIIAAVEGRLTPTPNNP